MNLNHPPSKKPRLSIQHLDSSQVQGCGDEDMFLQPNNKEGDDWDDDNLFIEAADEFDRIIALSQAVAPTGQVNHIKPDTSKPVTKLGTISFAESPKSSKVTPNNNKFQKSKSFNFDQVASSFQNQNIPNNAGSMSEVSIKQSDLYQTKCGENEILQKQIKSLTKDLSDNKQKVRQICIQKEKEKLVIKEEMNQKISDLKQQLDKLSTELSFQKNQIATTDLRRKEMKNIQLKEPKSPMTSATKNFMDQLNASMSGHNVTNKFVGQIEESPTKKFKLGEKDIENDKGIRKPPEIADIHYGELFSEFIGDHLMKSNQSDKDNFLGHMFGSDLLQLVFCKSFMDPKAKHIIFKILSKCRDIISDTLNKIKNRLQAEEPEERNTREKILRISCFTHLPGGINYDLLTSKKLYPEEEAVELRCCIQLMAFLAALSSFALSIISNVCFHDLPSDNTLIGYLEHATSLMDINIDITEKRPQLRILETLKEFVSVIGEQNLTKSYNGVLLSICNLVLEIFHQRISLSHDSLITISTLVKEIILSRPAPAVLESCVTVLSESTHSVAIQQTLCGISDLETFQTKISKETVHTFTSNACAIRVLSACLELIPCSVKVAKSFVTWTMRLLNLNRIACVRSETVVRCDCVSEIFTLFLHYAWFCVMQMCRGRQKNIQKQSEIRQCVQMSYLVLQEFRRNEKLVFLRREGIYEALIFKLETSNLDIPIDKNFRRELKLEKACNDEKALAKKTSTRSSVRTVICDQQTLHRKLYKMDVGRE